MPRQTDTRHLSFGGIVKLFRYKQELDLTRWALKKKKKGKMNRFADQ